MVHVLRKEVEFRNAEETLEKEREEGEIMKVRGSPHHLNHLRWMILIPSLGKREAEKMIGYRSGMVDHRAESEIYQGLKICRIDS